MTATTTTRTAPAAPVELPKRKIAVDRSHGIAYTAPATGKYVETRHITYKPGKKAAVKVRTFVPVPPDGAKWSAAVFDVITLQGSPAALVTSPNPIKWNGTYWAAAEKRARNMTSAVRLSLDCAEPGDVVTPRARRGRVVTPAASTPTTRTSAASRRAAANTRDSGAELTAQMAASITAQAAERQATQNARPSEGGGSEVAKRPVRNETATQRRNRVKREQREAARAARNATTTAALASIDSALSTPEGGTDANVTPSA